MGKRTKFSSNQVFNLFHEKVKLPGGGTIKDFLVVAPKFKSKSGLTGVAILPILIKKNAKGKVIGESVVLIEIYRPPVRVTHFEVPRGFIDQGENYRQACIRELKEEIGTHIKILSIQKIKEVFPEPGVLDGRIAVLKVEIEADSFDPNFKANEAGHKSVKAFTRKELKSAAGKGSTKIRDLVTCYCVEGFLNSVSGL
jgi:ADP-ribose pyrophosphatase YjhB (NUDIX family)